MPGEMSSDLLSADVLLNFPFTAAIARTFSTWRTLSLVTGSVRSNSDHSAFCKSLQNTCPKLSAVIHATTPTYINQVNSLEEWHVRYFKTQRLRFVSFGEPMLCVKWHLGVVVKRAE